MQPLFLQLSSLTDSKCLDTVRPLHLLKLATLQRKPRPAGNMNILTWRQSPERNIGRDRTSNNRLGWEERGREKERGSEPRTRTLHTSVCRHADIHSLHRTEPNNTQAGRNYTVVMATEGLSLPLRSAAAIRSTKRVERLLCARGSITGTGNTCDVP